MTKKYSTVEERLEILKKRNMAVEDSDIELLKKYNYYNLINGYKDVFLKRDISPEKKYEIEEEFHDGVKLRDLELVLKFDNKLRNIFLESILYIEEIIKNQIVESFYSKNKILKEKRNKIINFNKEGLEVKEEFHKDNEYLNRKYYDLNNVYKYSSKRNNLVRIEYYEDKKNIRDRQRDEEGVWYNARRDVIDRKGIYYKMLSTVYDIIDTQKKHNKSIKQYVDEYGYVPMWILMNSLTLGNVSYFYLIQREEVQKDFIKSLNICNDINKIDNDIRYGMSNILKILTLCRNICAHNERFYCSNVFVDISDYFLDASFSKKLPKHEKINVNAPKSKLSKTDIKNRYRARKGIYAFIYAITLFLKEGEKECFINKISKELNVLKESLTEMQYNEILRLMGLNSNWEKDIYN